MVVGEGEPRELGAVLDRIVVRDRADHQGAANDAVLFDEGGAEALPGLLRIGERAEHRTPEVVVHLTARRPRPAHRDAVRRRRPLPEARRIRDAHGDGTSALVGRAVEVGPVELLAVLGEVEHGADERCGYA